METIIKNYIESKCLEGGYEALKENYEASKQDVKGCCDYIMSEARKQITGRGGMVADPVVYGWAVHYFEEKLYEKKEAKQERAEIAKGTKVLHAAEVADITPKKAVKKEAAKGEEGPKPAFLLFDIEEL